MFKSTNKQHALTFSHFNRKGWSLFGCLHREVRIGVLSVATLTCATPRLMGTTPDHAKGTDEESATRLQADTLSLGEASVAASRAPLAANVAARQVLTLTRNDLAATGVHSVNDVLKLLAGVDVRQRGAFGIQTDISINGGTHDQITILLNGVPLVNPQTGHNAADFPVNISDIERIEVLEGAASRVMGSQAFSGAINVVTKQPATTTAEASAEGGSYATARIEARGAWTWGKRWTASASGSLQRSDGAVKNSDFKGGKAYGSLTHKGDNLDLMLQMATTANDFGASTFYSAAFPNQWEATRRHLLSLRVETKSRIHLASQTSWLRSLDHYQLTKHSSTNENFHRNDVFTVGVNAWTQWKMGRTAIGAELREETVFSTNLGHALQEDQYVGIPHEKGRFYTKQDDRTILSYYAEHNFVWKRATLSLGCMAERNNAVDDKIRFYPGIDLSYRPTSKWHLYVSWNKSMRLPTFTDLWYKSPTLEGNVGLKPEECHSWRVGSDFVCRVATVKLKAHYQRGSHMIDWIMRNPEDVYHATSFGLNNFGAGWDARLNLQEWWGKKQPFEFVSLSYAWLYQHRREGESCYKSNYAMEYLRHKFVAHLRHHIAAHLSADWTIRIQQREGAYIVYENLKPTQKLQPYGTNALLNCKLSWTTNHYNIFADLTNLTNHHYYDLGNVRQPGFMVMAGVGVKL